MRHWNGSSPPSDLPKLVLIKGVQAIEYEKATVFKTFESR